MRAKMTGLVAVALLVVMFCPVAAAQDGYFSKMGKTFTRGVKNLVSFPWEIPTTIANHDKTDDGNPRVFRDASGVVDGICRSVTRLGCGFWDVAFSVIPGDQEGLPLKPETFF